MLKMIETHGSLPMEMFQTLDSQEIQVQMVRLETNGIVLWLRMIRSEITCIELSVLRPNPCDYTIHKALFER